MFAEDVGLLPERSFLELLERPKGQAGVLLPATAQPLTARSTSPEPVLRDFHNIENRDALIDYDAVELVRDANGQPVTRWDGIIDKISPITGEKIPDEAAQVEQLRYLNPRKAQWPQAEYIACIAGTARRLRRSSSSRSTGIWSGRASKRC
nr:hypothetical protein [Thiocapsa imhoffii]